MRKGSSTAAWIAVAAVMVWTSGAGASPFVRHGALFSVGPNPTSIAAADLSGNGLPDIITADRGVMSDPREERPANDELSLLVAEGGLEYTRQPPLRSDFAPYAVVTAHVANPRTPDIIVGSFMATRGRDITYFRNLGGNLFEPGYYDVPGDFLPYTKMRNSDEQPVFTRPGVTSLAVEDVTDNGHKDIVAAGWSSDLILLFPGIAPENDRYWDEPAHSPAPGGIRDVALADFNGNGRLDLAATLYSSHEVGLWRNDGASGFEPVARFPSRGKLPHKIRVADVDGSGELDLVVSHCHGDDSVVIFYGGGDFEFAISQEIVLGENREAIEHEIRDLAVADFTGNGRMDIAVACYASSQVVVLINESESGGAPQQFRRVVYSFERGRPRALCVADFNGNGRKDIAVALWEVNAVTLLLGAD